MPECSKCETDIRSGSLCDICRLERNHAGVDHDVDAPETCACCGTHAPDGDYGADATGVWLCGPCQALDLTPRQYAALLAETPDPLGGVCEWAIGGDYPDQDPAELQAGFETASTRRAVADGGQQFEELPTPDRFFQAIGDAEVEMTPVEGDEITFRTNHIPGGRFGVELTASYSYAGHDCRQIITLDRDGAESLRDRLDGILETDGRGAGGGA